MNFSHLIPKRGSRGFTLLLAAITAAIVLALGSSIFTIAQKQVILSSIGKDSQFAFYAADAASECALYFDVRHAAFATTSGPYTPNIPIICDGVSVFPTVDKSNSSSITSYFLLQDLAANPVKDGIFNRDETGAAQPGNCADVTVYKNDTAPYTRIVANGYSVPCSLLQATARALQRSIEIRY